MSIENRGKSWSDTEDESLKTEFKNGLSVVEIANIHKRSSVAIHLRLEKLGLIEKDKELNLSNQPIKPIPINQIQPPETETNQTLTPEIEILNTLKSLNYTVSKIFIIVSLTSLYLVVSRAIQS